MLRVDRGWLRACVRSALRAQGVSQAALSLVLVQDAAIRTINAAHLAHDDPTDVITFPMSDPGEPVLSGEIILSTETARAVASGLGVPPERELALYAIHGVLHLCGFDDRTDPDRAAMEQRQAELLAQWEREQPAHRPAAPAETTGASEPTVRQPRLAAGGAPGSS